MTKRERERGGEREREKDRGRKKERTINFGDDKTALIKPAVTTMQATFINV